MNKNLTLIFFLIGCSVISGCRSPEIQRANSDIDIPEGGEAPTLPLSAQIRLLSVLPAEHIEWLNTVAYQSGDPCLLGVDGCFGGLYCSYILSKPFDEPTWENATVYGWIERDVTYENVLGEIVTRDITNISELFALPSWAMSAVMYEIKSTVLEQGPPSLKDFNFGVIPNPYNSHDK